MALPTAYLTTVRNLEGILNAIQGAQAPEKFTQKLVQLGGSKRPEAPTIRVAVFL